MDSQKRPLPLRIVVALGLGLFSGLGPAATFSEIGNLPGKGGSNLMDLSPDGGVAVGSTDATYLAYRWTPAGGLDGLGVLVKGGRSTSQAWGVSMGGKTVVGRSFSHSQGEEAFRWTEENGMRGLGDLVHGTVLTNGRFASQANAVSDDGKVVVGQSATELGFGEAFRWTETEGMRGLGDLPGGTFESTARALSGNGQVAVGTGKTAVGFEAFRWTESTGMVALSPGVASFANDVSTDGRRIVGTQENQPVSWNEANELQVLPLPPGASQGRAWAVSGDGSVIGGRLTTNEGFRAFLWREGQGMITIPALLAEYGLAAPGWTFTGVESISTDGQVIAGFGLHPHGDGWVIDLRPRRIEVVQIKRIGNRLTIVWASQPGLSYSIERSASLNEPWQPLGSTTAAELRHSFEVDLDLANAKHGFVRVTQP